MDNTVPDIALTLKHLLKDNLIQMKEKKTEQDIVCIENLMTWGEVGYN